MGQSLPMRCGRALWVCGLLLLSVQTVRATEADQTPPPLPPAPGQTAPDSGSPPNLPPNELPASAVQLPATPQASNQEGTPLLTTVKRRRTNLVIAGVSTLLATYMADRMLARDLSQSAASWVPLVGPFWILSEESARPTPNRGWQTLLVIDGVLQLSGLAVAIVGTFLRHDRLVLQLPAKHAP